MRVPKKRPPRSWEVDDLLDLGRREGVKATYLKAIPVLILERWVQGGREEDVANYVRTKPLARRLESSGLVPPFKPKGTSVVLAALTRIQGSRNLTRPPLIEYRGEGMFWVNLPHYEPLLQKYLQEYSKDYAEDYKKLFPEEPDWERLPKTPAEPKEAKPTPSEPEMRDDIHNLLAPLEQALRDRQQNVERLTEENQRLQVELSAMREEPQELSFVHTSPDFANTAYGAKVTSIKDTIKAMLQRAEHSIRISTRQMDMFEDDLIRLKQGNPGLEITVLSRGPEKVEGPRKKIAGRAFERMKEVGIKLPIEQDLLHSRMVVIDEQEVLVSSADLDYTQMEKEFNAGIWTDNPNAVAEATRYFDNLLKSPTVK